MRGHGNASCWYARADWEALKRAKPSAVRHGDGAVRDLPRRPCRRASHRRDRGRPTARPVRRRATATPWWRPTRRTPRSSTPAPWNTITRRASSRAAGNAGFRSDGAHGRRLSRDQATHCRSNACWPQGGMSRNRPRASKSSPGRSWSGRAQADPVAASSGPPSAGRAECTKHWDCRRRTVLRPRAPVAARRLTNGKQ